MTAYEQVRVEDGVFDAYRADPARTPAPGIVLLQEIFGINDNIRGLSDRLAEAGYVVLAPDMFWRIERRFERKDESGLADGMARVQQLDFGKVPGDLAATVANLRALPECDGRVGAVGFCLGGTLAFVAAAVAAPDAAVSYYGSGTAAQLELLQQISCPLLFHYGENDPYIPEEQIVAVEKAVADRADAADMTVHRYAAGHAFSNWDAPSMYDEAAATLAWERTLAFFARHLAQRT
ncbi:MAG: dienelactone hydrolase family protein [Pseudonocardia sp.]